MATATSQPSTFRPTSPENIKPNPHPYAIRTTSTGVLSRSNSTTRRDDGRYHYVPPSPTKEQHGGLREGETKKMQGRPGHRYTRSLNGSDAPMPIPLPTDKDGSIIFPRSSSPTKDMFAHSTSMPNLNAASPSPTHRPLPLPPSTPPPQLIPSALPANPKDWLPSQLATYLASELRVRRSLGANATEGRDSLEGQALPLPAPVAADIAEFIQKKGVTGKVFIRFTENDLEELHINPLWRTTLLEASQRLRRSVLQGRIWGFGSLPSPSSSPSSSVPSSPTKSDKQLAPPDNETTPQRRSNPGPDPTPPSPVPSDDDSSVSSASSSSAPSSIRRGRRLVSGRHSNGKVKGMVQSFEREQSQTRSTSPPPPPSQSHPLPHPPHPPATPPLPFSRPASPIKIERPLPTPPRPLPETPTPAPLVEEYDEVFIFGGTAKAPSSLRGSTRGNKFSSVRGSKSGTGPRRRPLGSDLFSGGPISRTTSSYTVEEPPSKPVAVSGSMGRKSIGLNPGGEEPSIEELLEQEEAAKIQQGQGAIAWEGDEGGTQTMKRITGPTPIDESRLLTGARAWEESDHIGKVTVKHVRALPPSSSSSSLAICAPPKEDEEDAENKAAVSPTFESKSVTTEDEAEDKHDEEHDAEIFSLKEQMSATRAMIDALERRVIEVESNVASMESLLDLRASAPKSGSIPDTTIVPVKPGGKNRGALNVLRYMLWSPFRALTDANRPTSLLGIPPYMFWVSLGMCAVVLKVVMRRTSGLVGRR